MKTPEYHLQLEGQGCFIISDHKWFHGDESWFVSGEYWESRGKTIIYPEHDLLWLDFPSEAKEPKRFKTIRDFRREFSGLPRWDKARWVVTVGINNFDDDCIVFPFNCRTGKRLKKPAAFSSHIGAIRNGKPFEIWWADPEYPAEVFEGTMESKLIPFNPANSPDDDGNPPPHAA